MDLDLSTRRLGEWAVVSVAGEVDLGTASQLADHASEALRDVSSHVVLDLAGVSFMDSTGLKVLVSLHRQAEEAGGSFAVAGTTRPVRRVLSVTGLDQVITQHESVDEVAGDPA
ncbi:MAG: STAS domain-containing protein [Actinomycetes bacterium]